KNVCHRCFSSLRSNIQRPVLNRPSNSIHVHMYKQIYDDTTEGGALGHRRVATAGRSLYRLRDSIANGRMNGRSWSEPRTPRASGFPFSRSFVSSERTKPSSGELNTQCNNCGNGCSGLAFEKREYSPWRSGEKTVWATPT